MLGELVRLTTRDDLELVGFYCEPRGERARRAVLHVHGLAGNFYENRFVSSVAEAVVDRGLAFLATNGRGHDYRSDNLRGTGLDTDSVLGGACYDVFEDSALDIAAGADYLESRGHREIYFEGHSLGTSKVVSYLAGDGDTRAVGLVLIAPPEMAALNETRSSGDHERFLSRALDLVRRGEGDALLDTGYAVPFSARTYVSMYGDPARNDVFPFRTGESGDYSELASLEIPILVAYGTADEAAFIDPNEAARLVRLKARSATRVETFIAEGANHVFWGSESALAHAIAGFVEP